MANYNDITKRKYDLSYRTIDDDKINTVIESMNSENNNSSLIVESLSRIPEIKSIKSEILENTNDDYIIESVNTLIDCDRILNNQSELENKTNYKSIFSDINENSDLELITMESCECINKQNIDFGTKFLVSLENTIYNLDSSRIDYNKESIISGIFEYYSCNEDYNYDVCKSILERSSIDIDNPSFIIEGKLYDTVKKKIRDFFKSDKKDKKSFNSLIESLYQNDPKNIIDNVPSIFSVISTTLAISTFAVSIPIGAIILLTNHILSVKYNRKSIDKIIKKYEKELEKMEDKADLANSETISAKYRKGAETLEKELDKLKEYRDKLYSDKENEDRESEEFDENSDILFSASVMLACKMLMEEYVGSHIYDERQPEDFSEMALLYNKEPLSESGSVFNRLKMIGIKFKQQMKKLSDKDKAMCNRIDYAYDKMVNNADRNFNNKNREAVIKGSILPSFSALLKLAMGSVGLGAVTMNPVLGAITFIGGLGVSKYTTDKERNYILQEIEVQLKVVEKKLQLAENNNDMKAFEQLLRAQKKLRQEKQRIQYHGRARNFDRNYD